MFFSPQYMKFHFCFTIVGQLYCHTANIAKVDMLIFCKWFRRKFSQIFWLNSHMASLADQISFEIFVDNICQNICWQYLPEYLLTIFARIFVDNICQNLCWQYLPEYLAEYLLTLVLRRLARHWKQEEERTLQPLQPPASPPPSQPLTCFGLDFSSNSKGFLEQFHHICFAKKYPNNRQQPLWFEILVEFQMIWKHS